MEKMNIDLTGFQIKAEEMKVEDGIVVKSRIPYSDKEQMAIEYVNSTTSGDEKLGICYTIYSSVLVWNYLFLKYYTNVDVSNAEDLTVLFDYAQSHSLMSLAVREHVREDIDYVYEIADAYKESVVTLFEKEHSLGYQVQAFLSEDVDTNIAETRELIEKLTDMKGALIEKEERDKIISFGKKKSANVKVGGMKLNLSKK